MAAFIRALGLGYRMLSSRPQTVRFSITRNARCITNVPCFSHRITRSFSKIPPRTIVYTENVFIDDDVDVRQRIIKMLIGRGGAEINRLGRESGVHINVSGHNVCITGTDGDTMRSATEKVTGRIQECRNHIHCRGQFKEKVFIDDDVYVRQQILQMLIGQEGANINRLKRESGVNIYVSDHDHQVHITGTDGDTVRSATEKVTQEIQVMRNHIHCEGQFKEKVFIDDDVDVCQQIIQMLIGQGGANINRLKRESGVHIGVSGHDHDVYITGTDGDTVRSATEKVTQEIQAIRNYILASIGEGQFKEKVFIDDDVDVCHEIATMLIGKGGANINRLKRESGVHIGLSVKHFYISGTDGDAVRSATERITQEIQAIRNHTYEL